MSCSQTSVLLTQSGFTVAITTVNWLVTARFKGYFGGFTALGACHGEHLASGTAGPVATATAATAATAVTL